ncbi:DUF397 domain-containing protein [Streptomyces goshikiensis]|uniref:DUF397 domain-containing protein n=1 Tax=Streptomyces goshikiensis TaxID=1942 RepID=A0ABZ1RIH8_9ACTN|nr:DUF397 domain-containing protein [Streptomyces goshikiensis]
MQPINLRATTWRKSSRSNSGGGACLEVSHDFITVVPVRDSKLPNGSVLVFPVGAWRSFVGAVRGGQLSA